MVNRSLNQVLMRSINTSLVAVLPVASLLIVGTYLLGGLVLRDFALALFVGLTVGAYSSIFVATPVLAWLKEREPRYRALRARAEADLARRPAQPVSTTATSKLLRAPAVVDETGDVVGDVGDVDDVDDLEPLPDEEVPAAASASSSPPAPAPRQSAAAPNRAPTAGRGAATPRPRQQRRKKRR
jgi:preprotein translocase subunit SecF